MRPKARRRHAALRNHPSTPVREISRDRSLWRRNLGRIRGRERPETQIDSGVDRWSVISCDVDARLFPRFHDGDAASIGVRDLHARRLLPRAPGRALLRLGRGEITAGRSDARRDCAPRELCLYGLSAPALMADALNRAADDSRCDVIAPRPLLPLQSSSAFSSRRP